MDFNIYFNFKRIKVIIVIFLWFTSGVCLKFFKSINDGMSIFYIKTHYLNECVVDLLYIFIIYRTNI